MTDLAEMAGAEREGALWWYQDRAARLGPVSMDELRRLAEGPLGSGTLVWTKTFGERWRRLEDVLASGEGHVSQPPDNGRWTSSFARFEIEPNKKQWSWWGLFGFGAYFWLGMWRRALVMVGGLLACELAMDLADLPDGSRSRFMPLAYVLAFSVSNLKRDYYRHRVLGETMWGRLRPLAPGYVCGGLAAALFAILVYVVSTDPTLTMIDQVAGVWQSDGDNVVIDVAGDRKAITFGGRTHAVSAVSADAGNGVIVFGYLDGSGTLLTLHKNWDEKHETYTFDLLVDDKPVANLIYVRPL